MTKQRSPHAENVPLAFTYIDILASAGSRSTIGIWWGDCNLLHDIKEKDCLADKKLSETKEFLLLQVKRLSDRFGTSAWSSLALPLKIKMRN